MRNTFLMTAVWSALVCLGLVIVWDYEARPGEHVETSAVRPESLETYGREFDFLVFLHPHCPCSMATVRELSHIVAGSHSEKLSVRVLAYQPTSSNGGWRSSRLLESARKIPGVSVEMDDDARVAISLGVRTSGHVILFSKDGNSLYSGGITVSRGHEGTNHGRQAVESILAGAHSDSIKTIPAFGCRIQ